MSRSRSPRSGSCADLAEERSALVDGALDLTRRELLLSHLVHCPSCRSDVADLRRLRDALRSPAGAEAPSELAQRLVSIAGTEAAVPLWSRPFRRTRPGSLTSRRRTQRLRRTAAAVAAGATVVSVAVVGYVSAPPAALAEVADPGAEARTEFSAVLAQFPLAGDAVSAVMSARTATLGSAPASGGAALAAGFPKAGGSRALSAAETRQTMERAAAVADTVGYTGRQSFLASSAGHPVSATVEIQSVAGQGTWSRVLDAAGQLVSQGFTRQVSTARVADSDLVDLLEDNYTLRAWAGARAAQRSATMVEARRQGRIAARWWVDDASGLVLAQQSFDAQGRPALQVAFTSLQLLGARGVPVVRPAQLALLPPTDTVLTLAAVPELDRSGWLCPTTLDRLSLVRLRSSSGTPTALHLVYSDGLQTVSVFEQRGRLSEAPSGSTWDATLGAYVQRGTSSVASWQSGGTVVTVVTDGSADLLAAAVASLPHEPAPRPTTMDKIRAGWGRILADVTG
ncbi:sigma-E factor regulatory protein RseB domain-containing protein [uncultured Friedmanniella sp.]|uniref:sigma-E factor regulatory protein RseB domain-containing protein n=1 Tax=uncultured Friedmanniella sp. TaxID=335381 RepID=UPI0035CB9A6E